MVSQHQHIVLVLIATLVSIASITFTSYRFLRPSVSVYESYNGKIIVKSTARQPLFFPQVAYFLEDGGRERFPHERKIIEQSLLPPIVNSEESYIDSIYNQLYSMQDKHKEISVPYTHVCVPMAKWQVETRPTCNSVHEIDVLSGFIFDAYFEGKKSRDFLSAKLVGKGGSRIVLKVVTPAHDNKDDSNAARDAALKLLRIDREFEAMTYERQRVDAVASDRLTPAREVVDIYGYCGMTTIHELSSGLLLADLIKKAWIWNPLELLELILQASLSIASVHSTDYPSASNASIVHNDIKPHNFVMSRIGVLKINDLNLAALLRWDITSSKKCGFLQRRFGGSEGVSVNSPPEMLLRNFTLLSEKVDVYSFGTLVFEFLSSKRLYEEELRQLTSLKEPLETKIIGLVTDPELPSLPSKIENSRDSTIVGLKNVMRQALQYNPNDRPAMQQIVNQLKGLYESPKQQKIVQNSIKLKLSYFWSNFDKGQ